MNGSDIRIVCRQWLETLAISRQQIIVIVILIVPLIVGLFITHWRKEKEVTSYEIGANSEDVLLTTKVAEIESLWYDAERSAENKSSFILAKKVDLNRASQDELTRLPGIGTALAQRIVAFREQKGRFSTVAELLQVKGIGKKKLEKLEPYLLVK